MALLATGSARAADDGAEGESDETLRLYGVDRGNTFGGRCLPGEWSDAARSVQAYSNDEWNDHGNLKANHDDRCAEADVPSPAT